MRYALLADVYQPWFEALARRAGIGIYPERQWSRLPREVRVLIRWGACAGKDEGFDRVLNRAAALRQAKDFDICSRRLRWHGLELMTKRRLHQIEGARIFRVELFDLQPLMVRRLVWDRWRWRIQSARETPPRLLRQAVSVAVRALNGLGLDFGRVDVGLIPRQRALPREIVCAVSPAPNWAGPWSETFLGRIRRSLEDEEASEPDWRFGADPEFVLVSPKTGQVVAASHFLPRAGAVGCDAQTDPRQEGVRPIAEIRPRPQRSPLDLVGECLRCLELLISTLPDRPLQWRAGSWAGERLGLGGHVHISGGRLSGLLLRALDTYVAVPVMLVEEPQASIRRRRRHGYLGDIRIKAHGGFEYRTLPSWLVSPEMARAILTLTAFVVRFHRSLPTDLFLREELVEAFYSANKEPFYPCFDRLLSDLEALRAFSRIQRAVEPLFDLILQRRTWDDRADFKRTWSVLPRGRFRSGIRYERASSGSDPGPAAAAIPPR